MSFVVLDVSNVKNDGSCLSANRTVHAENTAVNATYFHDATSVACWLALVLPCTLFDMGADQNAGVMIILITS